VCALKFNLNIWFEIYPVGGVMDKLNNLTSFMNEIAEAIKNSVVSYVPRQKLVIVEKEKFSDMPPSISQFNRNEVEKILETAKKHNLKIFFEGSFTAQE